VSSSNGGDSGSCKQKNSLNNKASLLGDPPPFHNANIFAANSVLAAAAAKTLYHESQGDGLLPLPTNIKPLSTTFNPLVCRDRYFHHKHTNQNNLIQGMIPLMNSSQQNNQGGLRSKYGKKISRPSRTNINVARRYSTTESDDPIGIIYIQGSL